MTEAEWLACEHPQAMLEFLMGKVDDRKLRLFACACCRRIWHLLTDERSRNAVEVAELFADAKADEEQLERAEEAANEAAYDIQEDAPDGSKYMEVESTAAFDAASDAVGASPSRAAGNAYWALLFAAGHTWGTPFRAELHALNVSETKAQTVILRDIFGNLFRPVAFDPAWRTDTAVALARQMYEAREFGAMPILADALQDAGCDNDDVLNHCRGDGPHVRGCWVVDLVLGKE